MKRILVIEFERNIRLFISVNLRARGFEVIEQNCPHNACERLKTLMPDVIVLDTVSCEQFQHQLFNTLNHSPCLKQVPVLLITTQEEERLQHDGRTNIVKKLMKPLSLPDLMEAVSAAL